jgi:hypothetical protein
MPATRNRRRASGPQRRRAAIGVALAAAWALAGAPLGAQELWSAASGSTAPATELGVAAHLRHAEVVALQSALLQAPTPRLRLDLGGEAHELVRTHSERRGDSFLWRGELAGRDGSLALFTTRGGLTSGVILDGERTWRVVPAGGGTSLVGEVDPDGVRECGARGEGGLPRLARSASGAAGGPATIDVLALYSAEAAAQAGGAAAMAALIENAVDLANVAFANSGVAARARLLSIAAYGAPERGDAAEDLEALSEDAEVAALRAAAGADVVSLFTADGGRYCGFAWYFGDGAQSGFNVTAAPCAVDYLIYPHELAHNLGADHNPENAGQPLPARDSYFPGEFRNLMSYAEPCAAPCPPAPYFSSPQVYYRGRRTGEPGVRDNVAVINANAAAVAAYTAAPQAAPGACVPSATTLCLAQNRFAVELDWRTAQGAGTGQVSRFTDRAGYFWFFDAENVEVTIKVVDACVGFGRFWVFLSGMTNVEVEVRVRDTHSGQVRTYHNPLNRVFKPVQDTDAFSTCG